MSRPVSSLSTSSDYSGLFGLEAIRFEDASDFVEHCDQCFSPEEFVQRKAELHAILDATKEASLAQSGLQQQALIKTYYEREALKEFKWQYTYRIFPVLRQDIRRRRKRQGSAQKSAGDTEQRTKWVRSIVAASTKKKKITHLALFLLCGE
nr:unnamed protein product [Haemonchus contortus]